MPRRLSKIRKSLVVAGMLVPVFLLIVVGLMLRRSQQSLITSSHWIAHTLQVESNLAHIQSLLSEAESAQRGYLLTQREEYLEPYRTAMAGIPVEEKELLALTSDNPAQQKRLKKLAEVIAAKTAALQRNIPVALGGTRAEGMKPFDLNEGQQLMREIHRLIADASTEEERLLQTREETMAGKNAWHTRISYSLIAVAGITAIGVLLLLWRLQQVQAFVTVCAWSRTIELNGEWLSFEDYLARRFGFNISHGISPEEAAKFNDELDQRRKQQERAAA